MNGHDSLLSFFARSVVMSLLDEARTGLREMPSNAAWLLSGSASQRTRSEMRRSRPGPRLATADGG